MSHEKSKVRFSLSPHTTGSDLVRAQLQYLSDATTDLEDKTKAELVKAIRNSSSPSDFSLNEKDLERLANAALTIGAKAIDRIERRIALQSTATFWGEGTNFRALATQIHSLANPARKIRNALAHRAKCVRAVLKIQNENKATPLGIRLASKIVSTMEEMEKWQEESWDAFVLEGSVSDRFHHVYAKEWREFCAEWIAEEFRVQQFNTLGLTNIFEKYLKTLNIESHKSRIQWESTSSPSSTYVTTNKFQQTAINVDLKRRQDSLTFSIRIPGMRQTDFNVISLDLMNLIETSTGLKHIDAIRGGKDPDILNIDVYGEYSLVQARQVLEQMDNYFQRGYPSRS